jgi:hypothetical protein
VGRRDTELVRRSVFVRIGELEVEVAALADIVTALGGTQLFSVGGAATKGTVTYTGANAVTIRSQA